MALMWKPHPMEVYVQWLDAIDAEALDKLDGWELSFIKSIRTQLEYNSNLSRNQSEKLESIYAKHTS